MTYKLRHLNISFRGAKYNEYIQSEYPDKNKRNGILLQLMNKHSYTLYKA